jgi:CheY-like chemotaxis protein
LQGQEALELVLQSLEAGEPYALGFVDVRMPPGWNGIETVERIWKHDQEIEIVLCTAYSDFSWDEIAGRLTHPERLLILRKPFDPLEVRQLAYGLTAKWFLRRWRSWWRSGCASSRPCARSSTRPAVSSAWDVRFPDMTRARLLAVSSGARVWAAEHTAVRCLYTWPFLTFERPSATFRFIFLVWAAQIAWIAATNLVRTRLEAGADGRSLGTKTR